MCFSKKGLIDHENTIYDCCHVGGADLAEANSFCDTVKQHVEYTIVLCKDDSTGGVAVFNKGGNDGLWFVLKSSMRPDVDGGEQSAFQATVRTSVRW
jgi:hypothetical protein